MSKNTFKNKFNKILMGVLVFFAATISVFAKCSDYNVSYSTSGPSTSQKNACTSAVENGLKCTYSYTSNSKGTAEGLKCYPSTTCTGSAMVYQNGKCVYKNTKTAPSTGYYTCYSGSTTCNYYQKGATINNGCTFSSATVNPCTTKKASKTGWYICYSGSTICNYYQSGAVMNSGCNYSSASTNPCKTGTEAQSAGFCSNSDSAGKTQAIKDNGGSSTITSSKCNSLYNAPDKYKSVWSGSCCLITVRNTSTGGSGSTKTGNTCGQSNYGAWTKSTCNAKVVSGKCHLWDSSKNCCNITEGSCNSSNTSTTVSKYDISFNVMGGYSEKFPCPTHTSATSSGVCSGSVASGTTVDYPSSANSKELTKMNVGAFIGWTKVLQGNGEPDCRSSYIDKTNKSVKVTSETKMYACYQEIIGDYRYVQDGYLADGGSVNWTCGQAMWIEYCTIENGTDYCYYYEGSTKTYRKVYRNKLANKPEGANCKQGDSFSSAALGYLFVKINGNKYSCGDQLYITTCTEKECNYTKIKTSSNEFSENGSIEKTYLDDNQADAKKACESLNNDKCSNAELTGNMGSGQYTVCFDKKYKDDISKIKGMVESYYKCDTKNGYTFDKRALVAVNTAVCGDKTCKQTYNVSCTRGEKAKPTLSVMPAISTGGEADIQVTAKAIVGEIVAYYYSRDYTTPTAGSEGWKPTKSNSFTIRETPGVVYIWVKDSNGVVSNVVSGAVIDTTNMDTTIGKLEVYDSFGNTKNPTSTGTAYNVGSVRDNRYVRLSNDLSKDSNVVADAFNPFDMEYKLEVNSPTVTVYATLTSTDSNYVEGYEPRTVNLKYGINTVLIKIQNKEGKTRTYTILVTRTDDRTNDNTLSEINLSVGEINFNANVTDYKIEIPEFIESVDVNAVLGNDKATYVEGYEPGTVGIIGDTTVNLIKVISETGSTRTYVLTFVKEGTDTISKESLQLADLVIPGVYVPFEKDVANYSISVGYETDIISLDTVLMDENSVIGIDVKRKNDTEYKPVSGKGIRLDVGENFIEIKVTDVDGDESYYRLTIIRKEFGLDISNDTTLKDLKVLGYDIEFKPTKKEYTVKIKQEKSLVITAVPTSNRAEVFIRGNDELTGFSTVRVKVIAENGEFETYSIDIKKDAFNKTIEIASIIAGAVIILVSSGIIIVKKKSKANREYFEE